MGVNDLAALAAWAEERVASPPDFWVGDEDDPQMERWYILPRNPISNVFLHVFHRDDPVFHDHPYTSTSLILKGGYREFFFDGSYHDRVPGEVITRDAITAHRIGLIDGPAMSLFWTGPWERDWGFVHSDRWIAAKDDPHYTDTRHWRR